MATKGGRKINRNLAAVSVTTRRPLRKEDEEKNKRCERLEICGSIFLLGLIALVSYMVDSLMDRIVLSLINKCLPQEIKDHIESAANSIDELFN